MCVCVSEGLLIPEKVHTGGRNPHVDLDNERNHRASRISFSSEILGYLLAVLSILYVSI